MEKRRSFLRSYLKHFHQLNDIQAKEDEFTSELETLFHQTNLTVLIYWAKKVLHGGLLDQNPGVSSIFKYYLFSYQNDTFQNCGLTSLMWLNCQFRSRCLRAKTIANLGRTTNTSVENLLFSSTGCTSNYEISL